MKEFFVHLLPTNWPAEISTFILSMVPVGELRFSIPWAVKMYGFSPEKAFLISVIGNILIGLIIFNIISPIMNRIECRGGGIGKLVCWTRERARKKGEESLTKWGSLGLFILVAIPFPGTGAWTGAMAAAFLGIKSKNTIPAIISGVIAAGILVYCGVIGFIKFI